MSQVTHTVSDTDTHTWEKIRSLSVTRGSMIAAGLYLLFSLADLLCSNIAFSYGIAEGNPVMAWLLQVGLFVPGKILLTLLVATVMVIVYVASHRWRWTVWSGVALMGAVVGYHLWALPQVMNNAPLFAMR